MVVNGCAHKFNQLKSQSYITAHRSYQREQKQENVEDQYENQKVIILF